MLQEVSVCEPNREPAAHVLKMAAFDITIDRINKNEDCPLVKILE